MIGSEEHGGGGEDGGDYKNLECKVLSRFCSDGLPEEPEGDECHHNNELVKEEYGPARHEVAHNLEEKLVYPLDLVLYIAHRVLKFRNKDVW